MLENNSTRRTKKPAAAAKKAAPKVVIETAPVGNGELSPSQGTQAAALFDSMPDLVNILAENIRHNTALLAQIDQHRAATQAGDRPAGVEQMRTILNYKAVGQMTGRRGDAFQRNLVDAHRVFDIEEFLFLEGLPPDAAKVSVQVDGDGTSEVVGLSGKRITLATTAGRDIGRIEVLNSHDEPLRLGPRMRALPNDTHYRRSE